METLPAYFERYHLRQGIQIHTIVKITNGDSDVMMFSDVTMELTDGWVWGLLKGHSVLSQSIDMFTRRAGVGNVTIDLYNTIYDGTNRLSDDPDDFWTTAVAGGIVEIYMAIGPAVSSLSDCYKYFRGVLWKAIGFGSDKVTLSVEDMAVRTFRQELPLTKVSDASATRGMEQVDKDYKLPIITGDWSGRDPWASGNYLVKGYRENNVYDFSWIVADHKIEDVVNIWFYLEAQKIWVKMDESHHAITLSQETGSDGRVRTICNCGNPGNLYGWAYLSPSNLEDDVSWTDYNGRDKFKPGENNAENESNCWDRKDKTFGTLLWGNEPVPGTYCGMLVFAFPNIEPSPGNIDSSDVKIMWRSRETGESGLTWSYMSTGSEPLKTCLVLSGNHTTYDLVWYGSTLHNSVKQEGTVNAAGWTDFGADVGWMMADKDLVFRFLVEVTAAADPFPGKILDVFQAMLRVYVNCHNTIQDDNSPLTPYFEIKGMSVGSEIRSRGNNPYYYSADSSMIKWTGHALERILRDQMGWPGSQIHTDSVDGSFRSGTQGRIWITSEKKTTIQSLFQEAGENSCYVPFIDFRGQLHMIYLVNPLNTMWTFEWSHLAGLPTIDSSDEGLIVNNLTFNYNYCPKANEYDTENQEHVYDDSQDEYGDRPGTANYRIFGPFTDAGNAVWIQMMAADNDPLPDTYPNALLSGVHRSVTWETLGPVAVHLQIGDWIEFDSVSMDPRLKLDGESWSGKKFVIFAKGQKANGNTQFKALQLRN